MDIQPPHNSRPNRRLGAHALTSANTPARPPATLAPMQLPDRDREIIALVARFRQLTTGQIQALVYPGQRHEPQRRAIKRLLETKLLARVTERLPGGARGGSQMYVYQLGTLGRKLYGTPNRGHSIVINHHALAVADVYVQLKEAERRGELKLLNWATEPDCHISIGGVNLKPDLYIDVVVGNLRWPIWIETDLGTEGRTQIMQKISDYTAAYDAKDEYPLPIYPTTLLLATRDERASELSYWLKYAKDAPDIFMVSTIDRLLTILQR